MRLLRSWFCSDPDAKYHADENALNAITATRLPGVLRADNNNLQRPLLYLNPDAAARA